MFALLPYLQAPSVDVPQRSFATYAYGTVKNLRSMVGLSAAAGFRDLRKHLLPKGDEEVRIWGGFGITSLGGTIFRKHGGKWTATRLFSSDPKRRGRIYKRVYGAPKSGWPVFWSRAEALGIWTLPDDTALPQKGRKDVLDGFSYVVELQRGGRYRAYAYNNPEYQKQWLEAKRMIEIGRLIDAEFPVPKG